MIDMAVAPLIFIEIAPFELDPPSPPVDDGFEPEADAVVVFVEFAAN